MQEYSKKNMQLMVTRYNLEQSEHELAELKVRQQELELKSVQSALYNSRQEATSFAVFLHILFAFIPLV